MARPGLRNITIGGCVRCLELWETYEYREEAHERADRLRASNEFEFVRVINRERWKPISFEHDGRMWHSGNYGIFVL